LQRSGHLPFERHGEAIEAEPEAIPAKSPAHSSNGPPPPKSDDDGRSSVSSLWGDDLLLEELLRVHHGVPGTIEYTPALDLNGERYRESPRYRAQQKQHR
jgi:hypothetical protein